MSDFLLELRSEEIPARMQAKAREDLARLFTAELAKAGITASDITTYATPRRLALIARGLPLQTAAVSEETKGPKVGAPPQALEGFLRKTGLTQDQLVERDGVYFAVIDKPGRATTDVLAEAIPAIIRAFPWPKSMRWGAASLSTESLRWVRPLQGIVALLDGVTVPCEVAGIASGRDTMGHRFMSRGAISIESAATYVEQLRDAHVIVDQDERANIIALGAKLAARKAGLTLIEDAGLLAENAGLTEWPVPLLGRFDEAFLSVPPEVIQLTARVNQKYFVCTDAEGKLANAFICTANIDAEDGGDRIVEGNRKVLAARLSDARFFYETDLKVPLAEQAKKLDRIVFHEKLGTVADKVERVAKLARWLCEEGIILPGTGRGTSEAGGGGAPQASPPAAPPLHRPADGPPPRAGEELATLAERAARLCKADLVTGMVGEFPELQGLMGGYYAAAQGEDPRVAAAIRDHYKPVGQGDEVPTDPVTVAVSLADKLDTLAQFFEIGEVPSGSRDPFALRRAALSIIALVTQNGLRLDILLPIGHAMSLRLIGEQFRGESEATANALRLMTDHFSTSIASDLLPAILNRVLRKSDKTPTVNYERLTQIMLHTADARDFLLGRVEQAQRDTGTRIDCIRASIRNANDGIVETDLVRLLARVRALQAFIGTEDGANLLAGYKRAANILKKEAGEKHSPLQGRGLGEGAPQAASLVAPPLPTLSPEGERALSYAPEPAEAALIAALDVAAPAAAAAVEREDFEAAMAALASLRTPIDAFFESVTVNDPDQNKRAARLSLLEKVRDAVHRVADFSKIEG